MVKWSIVGLCCMLLYTASAVVPFNALAAPGAAVNQTPPPADLRLAPGDMLHIQVLNLGLEQMSSDVVVQPDGKVKLPIQPPTSVNAAGLTLNQFEAATQQAFARFIRNPALVVTLKSAHISTVYLLGYFDKPGAVPIEGPMTVLDALALAGGAPSGDLKHVTLRHNNVQRVLNLENALRSPQSPDNVLLQAGDTLFVPQRVEHVTVQGQVASEKVIDFQPGMTLEDVLAATGGPTPRADISQVSITRADGTVTRVDLKQLMASGARDTTAIQPGDVVTVPAIQEEVTVLGEVAKPGPVSFREGVTLANAVALAGGENLAADLTRVRLARADDGSVQTVNLLDERKKDVSQQIVLRPGDVVTVPQLSDQVFVLGAVNHPGPEGYRPGMTVLEALNGAGGGAGVTGVTGPGGNSGAGGLSERADLYEVRLTHANGESVKIDLDQVLHGGDTSQNLTMRPGDTLVVPESKRLVYIFGAVGKPGTYVLPKEHRDLLDTIQMAGGLTGAADSGRSQLVQEGPAGKPIASPVHLDRLMRHGELQYNVDLKPGDVVYIPERGQSSIGIGNLIPSLILDAFAFIRH